MPTQVDLADLVSQLEAAKFTRLMRHMANLPIEHDALVLPAAAYGLNDTELFVRKFGGALLSLRRWAATWIYHQAYLPVGFWGEDAIVTFLKDRLTRGKRGLDAQPDSRSILYGSAQRTGDDYCPEAASALYYLASNNAAPLSDAAMDAVGDHFRETFGQSFEQFGFATPQSMAEAAPCEIRRFTLDLLNSPSSY